MSSQDTIADLLARYQAAFNLMGRLGILQHAAAREKRLPLRLATHSSLQTFAVSADTDSARDAQLRVSFDLPATGALDYLRNLTPVTKQVFDGLTRLYSRDALTVAGVNDQRIIAKVQAELAEVLSSGGTQAGFRKAVDAMTVQAGVERIASFELDTVFNTNVQKAYGADRYKQMNEDSTKEALPFWQYWTVGDDRVRPEHRVLDQFTARAIDTVWMKIYAPCGYNCRCSVVPLMEDEALAIDPDAGEDGRYQLPALAQLKVPQAGFKNLFGVG